MNQNSFNPKARWDRFEPESQGFDPDDLAERIEVLAYFKSAKIYPKTFLWNNKEYKIDSIEFLDEVDESDMKDEKPEKMFLRNHGTLTCGKTIHEAMFYTNHLEKACRVQIASLTVGLENLIIPDNATCKQSNNDLINFEKDLGLRDWLALKRNIK